MLQSRKFIMRSRVVASMVMFFTSTPIAYAVPVDTPLDQLLLTVDELPIYGSGWTMQHYSGPILEGTIRGNLMHMDDEVHFEPPACTPPMDVDTGLFVRQLLTTSEAEVIKNKSRNKDLAILLAPDSIGIESRFADILTTVSSCPQFSMIQIRSNHDGDVHARGTLAAIPAPKIPGHSKVYAYRLLDDITIKRRNRHGPGFITRQRHIAAIGYGVLIRDVWVIVAEDDGQEARGEDVLRVFTTQISKVSHAK